MNTKDIVKWAAIAVGGYLVWVYVLQPLMNGQPVLGAGGGAGAGTATGTPTGAQTGTPVTVLPTPTINISLPAWALALQPKLAAAAGRTSGLTPDQWNYYFGQVTGYSVPASAMAALQGALNGANDLTSYLSAMDKSGAYAAAAAQGQATPSPSPTPAVTVAPSIGAQLISMARSGGLPADTAGLTVDQWAYYYSHIPNTAPLTGDDINRIMASAGLTDATRNTPIAAAAFVQGIQSGVSGIVRLPTTTGGFGSSMSKPQTGWGSQKRLVH